MLVSAANTMRFWRYGIWAGNFLVAKMGDFKENHKFFRILGGQLKTSVDQTTLI